MRTYIKFYFNTDGKSPLEIIKEMKALGFEPEVGDFDFSIEWSEPQQYGEIIAKMHNQLKSAKALYTLVTREE